MRPAVEIGPLSRGIARGMARGMAVGTARGVAVGMVAGRAALSGLRRLSGRVPPEITAYFTGVPARDSMAVRYGVYGLFVHTMILSSICLLAVGVLMPFMTIKKFMLFDESQSLVEIVIYLHREGDTFLAIVVAIFSIVMPLAKIDTLYRLWSIKFAGGERVRKLLKWLEFVGKWSMIEVFMAAAAVFSVKSSGLADATTEPGLYFFAASVLLSLTATWLVKRVSHAHAPVA